MSETGGSQLDAQRSEGFVQMPEGAAPVPPAAESRSSANEERLKKRILSFSQAVSERYVAGMNEFRNNMRQMSRQAPFESVWLNDDDLSRIDVRFSEPVACCLYKQLYYQQYFETHHADPMTCVFAITNMSDMFNSFNSSHFHADIAAVWLWSIIDEFISLFEAMQLFKSCQSRVLCEIQQTTTPMLLLNPLQELVLTSGVLKMIESPSAASDKTAFMRALGYYSVIGLIRYHTFEGDYAQSLQLVDKISLALQNQRNYSGQVIPCILATNYYAAFSMLMARRYLQCVNTLSEALYFIMDTKDVEHKLQRTKSIMIYIRKMCHTLALVLTIYPIRVSEQVFTEMKIIVGAKKYSRLQEGDASAFSEVFSEALPSCLYDFEDPNINIQSKSREIKAFMIEVEEQICFLRVRDVLGNYSSISIEKLASYIQKSEEDTLGYLMSWKHRLSLPQPHMNEGFSPGSLQASSAEVIKSHLKLDYYIDGHMVYVCHVKPADKYATLLLEQNLSLASLQAERRFRVKI